MMDMKRLTKVTEFVDTDLQVTLNKIMIRRCGHQICGQANYNG